MTLDKLKQMYDDREFENYQEIVIKCNAVSLEQCLCYGHEFVDESCNIEKCYAASLEKPCSIERCMELEKENDYFCGWCRRSEAYCRHRSHYGGCSHEERVGIIMEVQDEVD